MRWRVDKVLKLISESSRRIGNARALESNDMPGKIYRNQTEVASSYELLTGQEV
jgi:hypothetical protein